MKAKQLEKLKADAIAAGEEQHPGAARYEPCFTQGKMMCMVVQHDGRGQLHDVGVSAK